MKLHGMSLFGLSLIIAGILICVPSNLNSSVISNDLSVSSVVRISLPESPQEMARSYFHPAWLKVGSGRSRAELASMGLNAHELVRDPEQRLERELQVPPALYDRVVFWTNIYSRYSSRMKVIHDRNHLGLVYGYLDLTPLYDRKRSLLATEMMVHKIEKLAIAELKMKISEAVTGRYSGQFHPRELRSIKLFIEANGGVSSPKHLPRQLKNIRSQQGQRDLFLLALNRSHKFIPEMETVFERHGLPKGLARIPFVESSFHAGARSKVRAVGIWQFMPRTARAMIDRKQKRNWADPKLQTRAAAKMLRLNRKILPDWGSAVTAYNSGVGRVARELRRGGGDNVEDLVQNRGLGFAGKNFYSEFLAAHILEVYRDSWLFSAENDDHSVAFEELSTGRRSYCSSQEVGSSL